MIVVIYLDYAATTPLNAKVINEMHQGMQQYFGNPSSLHHLGVESEQLIKRGRKCVAAAIGAQESEIYFTSGGTEANNLAILGCVPSRPKRIITTAIEHKSVLECFKQLEGHGHEVIYLKPNELGMITLDSLLAQLTPDTAFVSIMGVNNETGALQPVVEMGKAIKQVAPKALFHVDWIQGFCKLPLDVGQGKVDLLTMSAHKIFGPKGIGALYVRKGTLIKPRLFGGSQEKGLRPGTENFIGILGFEAAIQQYPKAFYDQAVTLKQQLLEGLKIKYPDLVCVSPIGSHADESLASPYILNVSFVGLKAEVLLHMLESKEVYVSTGSACNSKVKTFSHVLEAMGLSETIKMGAVRMSISPLTTHTEIETAIEIIASAANELKRMMR